MGFLHTTRTVDQVLPQCDFCQALYGYGEHTANGTPLDAGPEIAARLRKSAWIVIGEIVVCPECAKQPRRCRLCLSEIVR